MHGSARRQALLQLAVGRHSVASPAAGGVGRLVMCCYAERSFDETLLVKRQGEGLADSRRRYCAKRFYRVAEVEDVGIMAAVVVRRDLDPTIRDESVVVVREEQEVVETIWVGMEYYATAIVVPSARALAAKMTSVVRTWLEPLGGDCDAQGTSEEEGMGSSELTTCCRDGKPEGQWANSSECLVKEDRSIRQKTLN
ncbi:hypothetical protein HYALB_00008089 [Hymenoscyphus albidus]|uniref:Uncharacterized protein n=1 Tax=Hymenoscyphus albidus TaxID=595503 RepID=A0A9N9M3W4_9HELO|nr:hypothetical protein HYALB_00008089 [Hymenoscyphus albidus]